MSATAGKLERDFLGSDQSGPRNLQAVRLHPGAMLPRYQTQGAGCFDLHALVDQDVILSPGKPVVLRTGLAFEIPEHWVMMVYSRSGHGFSMNVRLANGTGIIDSDYRGEVMVKLTMDPGHLAFMKISNGDRIAQAVMLHAPQWTITEASSLTETSRGIGGLGSTGK